MLWWWEDRCVCHDPGMPGSADIWSSSWKPSAPAGNSFLFLFVWSGLLHVIVMQMLWDDWWLNLVAITLTPLSNYFFSISLSEKSDLQNYIFFLLCIIGLWSFANEEHRVYMSHFSVTKTKNQQLNAVVLIYIHVFNVQHFFSQV